MLRPHAVEEVVDATALLPESSQVGGETECELVFVHVTGEVLRPGVVELAAGSRVEAAIGAAEGVTEAAVLDGVNVTRIVIDGVC
ncbi:MAG: SLBB domain-containing protein [Leucobacter sp.]